LEEIDTIAKPSCLTCSDFANEYADISVGGLGSLDGYTTTVIRTNKGVNRFKNVVQHEYIEKVEYKDIDERKTEKTKMITKIVSFSKRKKVRSEKKLMKLSGADINSAC